jgi:uncharacterized membrane protein YhaH (DUF805 family)
MQPYLDYRCRTQRRQYLLVILFFVFLRFIQVLCIQDVEADYLHIQGEKQLNRELHPSNPEIQMKFARTLQ